MKVVEIDLGRNCVDSPHQRNCAKWQKLTGSGLGGAHIE